MDEAPDLVTDISEINVIRKPCKQNLTETFKRFEGVNDTEKFLKIPISIITGYLGSGKSTLINKVSKYTDKKIAIILNEFGDSSLIEKSITIKNDQSNDVIEWLEIGNGCLCCSVKDIGVLAIENLLENTKNKIDYILLETTGLSDPGMIIKSFWIDSELSTKIYLDGIITVVDAENIELCLSDEKGEWHVKKKFINPEDLVDSDSEFKKQIQKGLTIAHLQIALGDVIILNKIDLVSNEKLLNSMKEIKQINNMSPIYCSSFGKIELDKIFNLHCYESNIEKLQSYLCCESQQVRHSSKINTVKLTFPFFSDESYFDKIESYLQKLLWEKKCSKKYIKIQRVKGILAKKNGETVVKVIQAVRNIYDIIDDVPLLDDLKENILVFIGENLSKDDLLTELNKFIK